MAIQTPPIKKGKPGEDKMAQAQAAKRPPVVAPAPPKKVIVPARTVLKNSTPKAAPPKAAPIPSYGWPMPVPKTLVRPPVAPPTDERRLMGLRPAAAPQSGFMQAIDYLNKKTEEAKNYQRERDFKNFGMSAEESDRHHDMMMGMAGMTGDVSGGIANLGKLGKLGMKGLAAAPGALSAVQKAIAKFFPKGVANVADDVAGKSGELAQYSGDFAKMMSEVKYREQLGRVGNPADYVEEVGNSSRSFLDMLKQSLAKSKYKGEFKAAMDEVTSPKVINAGAKVSQDLTPAKLADFNLMQTANSGAKSLTAVELALRELASKGVTFPKALQKLTDAQAKKWMQGDISFSKVPPASKIPTVAKAIAAALGIPFTIGAVKGINAMIEDQTNISATQGFRDKNRIEESGEDENRYVKKAASATAFKSSEASRAAAAAAVAAASSAPPAAAPSVSTSTDAPPTDPRLQDDYLDSYMRNKNSRDREAGTTTAYDPEKDPIMMHLGNRLFMMLAPERQAAVEAVMDKHTQELMAGGQTTFTQEQIMYLQGFYAGPDQNPAATTAAAAAAAAAASGGGGGKGASIEIPPALQAPPANTGVPEPTTWAEQMARYQDMQNMFNKPVPEPDRTRENELYALLQSSQAKQDQLTQQYMELLMKQLTQQQQQQPSIPAVPAPATGSPSGNAFPLSNISQVARQGSNLQFSNAGLGYLNSIDPALLQALMQYLKAQQYTGMGQMGTYGELNYGRAGGVGPLTMNDASFENPLNYAGLTTQMREPAEAGLRSLFAQMGLMG